jgi:hypothetical protein
LELNTRSAVSLGALGELLESYIELRFIPQKPVFRPTEKQLLSLLKATDRE